MTDSKWSILAGTAEMERRYDATIIVVAWNVGPLIAEAVQSCIDQTHESVEIVIVENGSTDGTLALIQGLATGRNNVRIAANPTNIGVGPARNLGLDLARGEYIAFLDGDDWLEPGAIAKAIAAAREHNADVVIFDHSRHHVSGRVQRGHNRRFLIDGYCKTLEQRIRLVRCTNSAWNKFYRLAFLKAEGFRFASTTYEDVDWSLPVMIVAPRVAAMAHSLINYRFRQGSILRSAGAHHFDIFERCLAVGAFLRNNAARIDPAWPTVVAREIAGHIETLLRSPTRGNFRRRVEYAREASRLYREIDPHCRLNLTALRRMRYWLIWHGYATTGVALTVATTFPKR